MNAKSGSVLEGKLVRALPGLFLRADLRLHPIAGKGAPRMGPDALFELEIDGGRIPIHVEVKGRYSPTDEQKLLHWMANVPEGIVLLALPRIPQPARARLRAAGISHADLTGTIYLRAPGIRIDITGMGRPPRLSARQQVNPFSKRASLVSRALLAEPSAVFGVTALAGRLEVGKGWVSQVLAELVAREWVQQVEGGMRVVDPVAVLHAWSLEYTWRDNAAEGFTLPFEHDEILERLPAALNGLHWGLTLQSGAALLAPQTHYKGQIHFYVDPANQDVAVEQLERLLHAEPTPSAGNLQLLRPYYGAATFYDLRERGLLPIVSPVQLFLDLAHFPVRGPEAATAIARGVLALELNLRAAEVSRLVEDLT